MNPHSRTSALLAAALAAALSLTACKGQSGDVGDVAKAPDAAPAAPAKPVLGEFGLDLAAMDTSVAAGDDFFAYTNGTWFKTFEIPADRSRYGSFTRLTETALERERAIVEGAAADANASGDARKIGDAYQAFMDEAAIEAKGIAPVQPQLDAIAAITDTAALSRTLGEQLRADAANCATTPLTSLILAMSSSHGLIGAAPLASIAASSMNVL